MKFTKKLVFLYATLLCVLISGVIGLCIARVIYRTFGITIAGRISNCGIIFTVLFKFILNYLTPITAMLVSMMYLKKCIRIGRIALALFLYLILIPVIADTIYSFPMFLYGIDIPGICGPSDPQGYIMNFPYLGPDIESLIELFALCLTSAIIIAMSIKINVFSLPKR